MSFKYPSFGDFDRHCVLSSFPVTMHTHKSCALLPTKFHRTLCRGFKRALNTKNKIGLTERQDGQKHTILCNLLPGMQVKKKHTS